MANHRLPETLWNLKTQKQIFGGLSIKTPRLINRIGLAICQYYSTFSLRTQQNFYFVAFVAFVYFRKRQSFPIRLLTIFHAANLSMFLFVSQRDWLQHTSSSRYSGIRIPQTRPAARSPEARSCEAPTAIRWPQSR